MDRSLEKLAVLFADVSGSTRLYEQHGDVVARTDLAQVIELLQKVAAGFSGETLKTIGDEIMCAFVEPVKAALAATEMQAALREASERGQFKMGVLHIKVGWHYGAVDWREDDLIGEAAVTAQQVIKMAKADEILTTKQSVDQIPPALFPEVHPLEHVAAEAWDGELHVYKMPWERGGDETQMFAMPRAMKAAPQVTVLLSHAGHQLHMDSKLNSCRIGRGVQADLQVNGRLTSRQHAEITLRNGRVTLRDESTNGTFVVQEDGARRRLRREEDMLTGRGQLGFGTWPDEEPAAAVAFEVRT
jgi:adenylate cyclase